MDNRMNWYQEPATFLLTILFPCSGLCGLAKVWGLGRDSELLNPKSPPVQFILGSMLTSALIGTAMGSAIWWKIGSASPDAWLLVLPVGITSGLGGNVVIDFLISLGQRWAEKKAGLDK